MIYYNYCSHIDNVVEIVKYLDNFAFFFICTAGKPDSYIKKIATF